MIDNSLTDTTPRMGFKLRTCYCGYSGCYATLHESSDRSADESDTIRFFEGGYQRSGFQLGNDIVPVKVIRYIHTHTYTHTLFLSLTTRPSLPPALSFVPSFPAILAGGFQSSRLVVPKIARPAGSILMWSSNRSFWVELWNSLRDLQLLFLPMVSECVGFASFCSSPNRNLTADLLIPVFYPLWVRTFV